MGDPNGLVRVEGVESRLLYARQGLAGAMRRAYLSPRVVPHLSRAVQALREQNTPSRTYGLRIWDAYRTPQTQAALYDRCVRALLATEALTSEEASARARAFVAPPTAVFPHGTGGAVDTTLLVNGEEAPMGTGFDEFIPRSASDWYRDHPPQTEADRAAWDNRETLRTAMESAGFVGLDSEWWHFEWGTRRWAESTWLPIALSAVLPPP